MKKLMTVALLLMVFQVKSQTFEGTVKWSMKMDINDPKTKAQMEEVQKKMNDPATQAKMKDLEEKMKDPKFKAMMDANPQMKAQMESMMKMQQGGGGMNAMMPKGMTMRIKGGNTLTKMDGGMMDGYEVLHMKEKNQIVRLDRVNKTYIPMPTGSNTSGGPSPVITKTRETATILGYTCTKYVGEVTERGTTMKEIFWTTTDIKDLDMKSLGSQRMGPGSRPVLPDGVEGVPLKIEIATPEGNTMVMEVTEIKRESLNASDFTIPSDYKEGKMTGRF